MNPQLVFETNFSHLYDRVSVRLGDHDLFSDSDGVIPLELPVNSVIQNPNYNPTSFQNDIAIIKLKRPIDSYSSKCILNILVS